MLLIIEVKRPASKTQHFKVDEEIREQDKPESLVANCTSRKNVFAANSITKQ